MQEIELKQVTQEMGQWRELEALFQSEWADLVLDEHYKEGAHLPHALMALKEGKVIGGLAFSRYKEPNKTDEVVWINALVVHKDCRGQGLASNLLRFALDQLAIPAQAYLYANTNVAPLYTALGWFIVDTPSEVDHHIVAISLVPE